MINQSRASTSRASIAIVRAVALALVLTLSGVGLVQQAASAAGGLRVMLRVLLVTNGGPEVSALAAQLDRESVPYTSVNVWAADRPVIDAAFLADAAAGTGRFQAVIVPNASGGGLAPAELDALAAYERAFGVRQVNAYDFLGGELGFTNPAYAGFLDGGTAAVTAAARLDGFGYLAGTVPIDDVDPDAGEVYGYLGVPADVQPEGRAVTPLLTATFGEASGVLAAVVSDTGREQLVVGAAMNQYMETFSAIAPGIISWATRGIHLGYQRNYLNVHIDDVLMSDSRWSVEANCTPGDDCIDPQVTTPDIRMTTDDVARLLAWQGEHGVSLDMVFNAVGSVEAAAQAGGPDPLTTALLAKEASFRWINHTYSHPYLGCIQIAPAAVGQTWRCATSETDTPRMDPDLAGQMSGGTYWAAQSTIEDQIRQNASWASTAQLTRYRTDELVTGEHSGLASLPQMPTDNPFLAPALGATGIAFTASDASREPQTRTLAGAGVVTLPRHPMNVYYNTATFSEAVDEYNWYYTAAADGGSGICENNPASTCIRPLPTATAEQARESFTGYIRTLEARNLVRYMLTNDPRPVYAHQSNLAEDGLLFPVLDEALARYRSVYDAAQAPLVQVGMRELATAMTRASAFSAVAGSVEAYVDSRGVHVPAAAVEVPLTVPAGSVGGGLEPYAGQLSGWSASARTVTLPTYAGGYTLDPTVDLPSAPSIAGVTAGSTTATVAWNPPADDGGSPLTGYQVSVYAGSAQTLVGTRPAAADATSLKVTGLTNGTTYRFTVAASNSAGVGPASLSSAAVTPRASLGGVPTAVQAEAGNASARVAWTLPSTTDGVTGYRVRAFLGGATTATRYVTVPAGRQSASVTNLVNGSAYTFDVTAMYGTTGGTPSARTAEVTPTLSGQTASAPVLASVIQGNQRITLAWSAPQDSSAGAPSGYRVQVFAGTGATLVRTTTLGGTATSTSVTGLTNGSPYSAQVSVVYPSGTGPASARSAAVVPNPTPPAAPLIGTASSGFAGGSVTATARWSAPTSTGGSPITGYLVTAHAVDGDGNATGGQTASPLLPASARSYVMALPAAGQYRFTVAALNAYGTSAASAASNVVTGQ